MGVHSQSVYALFVREGFMQFILLDGVWDILNPSNILFNNGFMAGLAKVVLTFSVTGTLIGIFAAIAMLASGNKDAKELITSKLTVLIFIGLAVSIIDAILLTARGLW